MSGSYDHSPGSPFKYRNSSADSSRNYRSPFLSPSNGHQDFPGSSPMKRNFGWRNNPGRTNRFFHPNDQHNQYFSPRGGRRVGHFRGGGGPHRGSPRNNQDISLYVNKSMLSDPWRDLTELLEPRMRKSTDPKVTESSDNTANDSRTSINTSSSVTEQVTEDSLLISDTSGNVSDQIIEECTPTKSSATPQVHET